MLNISDLKINCHRKKRMALPHKRGVFKTRFFHQNDI